MLISFSIRIDWFPFRGKSLCILRYCNRIVEFLQFHTLIRSFPLPSHRRIEIRIYHIVFVKYFLSSEASFREKNNSFKYIYIYIVNLFKRFELIELYTRLEHFVTKLYECNFFFAIKLIVNISRSSPSCQMIWWIVSEDRKKIIRK